MPLTRHEVAAILAGLRLLQRARAGDDGLEPEILQIATADGTVFPLDDLQIDALCERLNFGGTVA